MKFKSDKQRKAVMANLSNGNTPNPIRPSPLKVGDKVSVSDGQYYNIGRVTKKLDDGNYLIKNRDKKEVKVLSKDTKKLSPAKKKLAKSKTIDSDGDGIKNNKDCEPFNPKKQGFLHDLQIKRLKSQESKLEEQRLKLQKKLEDDREVLQRKLAISNQKDSIRQSKLKVKQQVIDEINREKSKIKEMEEANRKAKKQIFDNSPVGRLTNYSKSTINKTRNYLAQPKTKKKINKFMKKLGNLLD